MAIVNGAVQGGTSTGLQHVADIALAGWASGATLSGGVLTGATPDDIDGMSKADLIAYYVPPAATLIQTVVIPDGGNDKLGIYEITSMDATTLKLTRIVDLGDKDSVVPTKWGDLGFGGGSYHFRDGGTSATKRFGGYSKLLGRHHATPDRITVTTVYPGDQAGTLSGDGLTYTLSSSLPANDGITPTTSNYVLLVGQGDEKENGIWEVTAATTLERLSWFNDLYEMKANHEVIVVSGNKYRNSVWRAVSSANINPASTTVRYECIQKGLYTDDTALTYLFDESSGDVLNRSIHAGSIGMDGVPNNSPERQTGGPSPRTPYCMYFPATAYLEVANPEHFLCDNTSDWSVEAWVKTSGGEVFLMMRDASGTWGTNARRMYVASNNFYFDVHGVSTFTFTHGSLCNGDWHKVQFYHRLRDASGNGILSLVVDGEFIDEQTCALGTSNTGHTVRVGYAASSAVGYVADLQYRHGAQHA